MKKVLNKKKALANKDFLIKEIIAGKIFIYPTDTLYGLGANAQLENSVKKIFEIKKRSANPLLIVVPSMNWIFDNCIIENNSFKDLIIKKLPGSFSFILNLKNKKVISPIVNNKMKTIGVRLPNHWFSKIISESLVPFTSTSVNYSEFPSAKIISEIPTEIINLVDYIIIDDESVSGKRSEIIDLTNEKEIILRK